MDFTVQRLTEEFEPAFPDVATYIDEQRRVNATKAKNISEFPRLHITPGKKTSKKEGTAYRHFFFQATGIVLMEPLKSTKTYGGNINIGKIGRHAL